MLSRPMPPCTLITNRVRSCKADWAGDNAAVINTDTGEAIPVSVFVASLPYQHTYWQVHSDNLRGCDGTGTEIHITAAT